MMNWNLSGKTALITGASSILGQVISTTLAKAGVNLILHYNNSYKNIKILTDKLDNFCCNYKIIKADFTKPNDISNILAKLSKYNIDILINNASIDYKKHVVFTNLSHYDNIFDINLKAPYIISKNMVRKMISKKNGTIINISSSITKHPRTSESAYAMTKCGIETLTQTLAKEVGEYNIRVNCIAPGPFSSSMNDINDQNKKQIIKLNALKRIITTEEVANTVLFLCSDFSSAITGQVIRVDNGFTI